MHLFAIIISVAELKPTCPESVTVPNVDIDTGLTDVGSTPNVPSMDLTGEEKVEDTVSKIMALNANLSSRVKTLNDNLYNSVTNGVSEMCDSALEFMKRISLEKKNGVAVANSCLQFWELDVILDSKLLKFKSSVTQDLQEIRTVLDTIKTTIVVPKVDRHPLERLQEGECGLTMLDLENFFTFQNCLRNGWTCIPWILLVVIAFGAVLAGIVACITADCSCGYSFQKRRDAVRPRRRVTFDLENNANGRRSNGGDAGVGNDGD